jgi:hypothetical protein
MQVLRLNSHGFSLFSFSAPRDEDRVPRSSEGTRQCHSCSRASWHLRQYRAHGTASSRFTSISAPHWAHSPKLPWPMRLRASVSLVMVCRATSALCASVCLSYSAAAWSAESACRAEFARVSCSALVRTRSNSAIRPCKFSLNCWRFLADSKLLTSPVRQALSHPKF